jgi:RNA polymerase sigma factor (sigma-70 family)
MSIEVTRFSLIDVFVANRARLCHLARKIVGTVEIAEEVTQDAYLKLVDGTLARVVDNPLGYCCQIVRNVAIDHCRRVKLESKVRVYAEEDALPEVAVACESARRIDDTRLIGAIDRVLGTLPARTRQAFELFRLGEVTQREIGVRLGCSATLVNFMVRDAQNALESLRMHRDVFG